MANKSNWLSRGHRAPETKKYKLRRFVIFESDMYCSMAFKSLSAQGMWVLMRFLQKRKWDNKIKKWNVYVDEPIAFTYKEAEAYGVGTSQFHSIIKKLVEVGFIDVEHQGGYYGKDYSRFKLSQRWREYATPLFIERKKGRVLQAGLDVQSHKAKIAMKSRNRILTENHSFEGSLQNAGYLNLTVGETLSLDTEVTEHKTEIEGTVEYMKLNMMVMKRDSLYILPYQGCGS